MRSDSSTASSTSWVTTTVLWVWPTMRSSSPCKVCLGQGVQRAERLVHQQHPGLHGQRGRCRRAASCRPGTSLGCLCVAWSRPTMYNAAAVRSFNCVLHPWLRTPAPRPGGRCRSRSSTAADCGSGIPRCAPGRVIDLAAVADQSVGSFARVLPGSRQACSKRRRRQRSPVCVNGRRHENQRLSHRGQRPAWQPGEHPTGACSAPCGSRGRTSVSASGSPRWRFRRAGAGLPLRIP
jgi:hypothetical protein